ncbi:MAG: nucleotidyltransferase substrate binding protein [Chitinophagales bacterium]|nr:nucleotidyltransferase substrate binding protein [Chitinophagales bacterium]
MEEPIDTRYLQRCTDTLEKALQLLNNAETDSIDYEMYRSACIKEFEIILEQSGKLLRKALKPYFHTPREADKLVFKDIFRHAALHGLLDLAACERWLAYRDNRNSTAHDYGEKFAEATLSLLPSFIDDARALISIINRF